MERTDILKKHGLRNTSFRLELLALFYQKKSSLSVDDIKRKIKTSKDKVTIYRALDAFENAGLIHKVPNKKQTVRYALCPSECDEKNHNHNHAHFICNGCNDTFCVEDLRIPIIDNKAGFEIQNINITLEGLCKECKIS